jgi:hypothetical protein
VPSSSISATRTLTDSSSSRSALCRAAAPAHTLCTAPKQQGGPQHLRGSKRALQDGSTSARAHCRQHSSSSTARCTYTSA